MVKMEELNIQTVYVPFVGIYVKEMPKLIKAGLRPMSVSDLMERRLEVLSLPEKDPVRYAWWEYGFGTVDGAAYFGNNVKIVLDAQALKEINPRYKLSHAGRTLTPKQYSTLEGEEISREDLEEGSLTKEQAKKNLVWRILAGDQHLLDKYVDAVFAKRGGSIKRMGVSLSPHTPQDMSIIYDWHICGHFFICEAQGGSYLDMLSSTLVGICSREPVQTLRVRELDSQGNVVTSIEKEIGLGERMCVRL